MRQVNRFECENCRNIHESGKGFVTCSYCSKEACHWCLFEFERPNGDLFYLTVHTACMESIISNRKISVMMFRK